MPPKTQSGAAKRKRKREQQNYIFKTNKKINSFLACSQRNYTGTYKIILWHADDQ